ncbi:uncharacterized protein LOC120342376 [Styela clava]
MGKKTQRTPEELTLEKKRNEEFKDKIRARREKLEAKGNQRGVVLLSHIPLGFYEPQMYEYFSQFGRVTRLKLIRSKKTGKSRQFAFIEFQFEEVAKIAAKTMNNYLMFQKILKCRLIPLEEVKPNTFSNWRLIKRVPQSRTKDIKRHNQDVTDPEKIQLKLKRLRKRRGLLNKKLREMDIDYDVMNIKVNDSFVSPERTRASPEELADVYEPIPDSIGMEYRYSDGEDFDGKRSNTKKLGTNIKKKEESNDNKTSDTSLENGPKVQSTDTKSSMTKDDEEFGVMVVDLEDPEVTFKSPPTKSNIKLKSVGVSSTSKRKRTELANEDNSVIETSKESVDNTPLSAKQKRLLKIEELKNALNSKEDGDDSLKSEKSGKKIMKSVETPTRQIRKKLPRSAKKPKIKTGANSLNKTM